MQWSLNLNATTSKSQNVFSLFCCLAVLLTHSQPSHAASNTALNAREIMQRSLDAGDRNAGRLHEYASSKRVDEKQLDLDGSVRSETVKSYEDVVIDGVLLRKLVAKDGKPLPTSEERKEDERVNRIATSRKNETPSERARRLAAHEKKRAQIFPHLKGKVWIDQQDFLWTKAEAVAIDPFSVGFGHAIAHVAVVKRIGIEQVSTFDNFRKAPAGVQVVEGSTGN
jgi:hypothetical protein